MSIDPKDLKPPPAEGHFILPEQTIEAVGKIWEEFASTPEIQKELQKELGGKELGQGIRELLRETPADALNEAAHDAAGRGVPLTAEAGRAAIKELDQEKAMVVSGAAIIASENQPASNHSTTPRNHGAAHHPRHGAHHTPLKAQPIGNAMDTVTDDLNFVEQAMLKTRGRSMTEEEGKAVRNLPPEDRVEFDRIKKANAYNQIP